MRTVLRLLCFTLMTTVIAVNGFYVCPMDNTPQNGPMSITLTGGQVSSWSDNWAYIVWDGLPAAKYLNLNCAQSSTWFNATASNDGAGTWPWPIEVDIDVGCTVMNTNVRASSNYVTLAKLQGGLTNGQLSLECPTLGMFWARFKYHNNLPNGQSVTLYYDGWGSVSNWTTTATAAVKAPLVQASNGRRGRN